MALWLCTATLYFATITVITVEGITQIPNNSYLTTTGCRCIHESEECKFKYIMFGKSKRVGSKFVCSLIRCNNVCGQISTRTS
jgi:hypothetical protein